MCVEPVSCQRESPFTMQAEHLVQHFHCYAVDLRGSGDSTLDILPETVENGSYRGGESLYDAQNGFPTLRGYAADVVALVDHLCVKGETPNQKTLLAS